MKIRTIYKIFMIWISLFVVRSVLSFLEPPSESVFHNNVKDAIICDTIIFSFIYLTSLPLMKFIENYRGISWNDKLNITAKIWLAFIMYFIVGIVAAIIDGCISYYIFRIPSCGDSRVFFMGFSASIILYLVISMAISIYFKLIKFFQFVKCKYRSL
jgi:hypothetical protein